MFGLGKKKDAGAAPEAAAPSGKKKSSGGSNFDAKMFALKHFEKLIVGVLLLGTGYLIYSGTNVATLDEPRTTDALATQVTQVRSQVEANHWEQIAPERQYTLNFRERSERSRQSISSIPYRLGVWENVARSGGGKRSDPKVAAPLSLRAEAFMGALAVYANRSAPIDALEAAPPLNERRRSRAPAAATDATPAKRLATSGYDFGVSLTGTATSSTSDVAATLRTRTAVEAEVIVPQFSVFNCVTAAIPHEEIANAYNAALEDASNFDKNRDSPNYLGYEVQRIDLSSRPNLTEIQEADWQPTNINIDDYKKLVESWPNTADEVSPEKYIVEDITADIPPILLQNYSTIVDHPRIPRIRKTASAGGGGEMDAGYGSMYGGGGGDYGGAFAENEDVYANDPMFGGGGAAAAAKEVDTAPMPKALEMSDFKLLRFFDFEVQPGHAYIYRVRLILEDPNYPRNSTIQPATSTMEPEVVTRVQDLRRADDQRKATVPAAEFQRTSRLLSDWSEPSEVSIVPSRSRLMLGPTERRLQTFAAGDNQVTSELSVDADLLYGEWDPKLATFVPLSREGLSRGTVLGGKDVSEPLDVIHPINKEVRSVPSYQFSNEVLLTDIRGGLDMSDRREDPLPSQGQIVGFNAETGGLIVTREYDDFVSYRLYSFADEREKLAEEEQTTGR